MAQARTMTRWAAYLSIVTVAAILASISEHWITDKAWANAIVFGAGFGAGFISDCVEGRLTKPA